MSSENKITEQQLFDQLISSLVHSAWVFMGKIKNPLNDQLEKDIDQASIQIDMLDMLFKRMKGNLSENEDQYLGHLISELKMNFVEEQKKPTEKTIKDGKGEMGDGKGEKKDSSNEKEKGSKKTKSKSNGVDEKKVEEKPKKDSEDANNSENENSEEAE
ncbi:MAG: DUF1844 domain-containing protein [Candidatus Marinimicrobia bacterium]|nr:DUF1844 domain-containing protein [Candidatus Neomarinimicrobiota bacterium]